MKWQRIVFWGFFMHVGTIFPISIVYNFRIAQITKQPIFKENRNKHHTTSALAFDQWRKKYSGILQNFVGGLGTYIYSADESYFRIDFAVSRVQESCRKIVTFSDTETDDILFTLGRNFVFGDRTLLTLSALLGLPTHEIYRLQHIDFGYAQVGMGVQLDGAYEMNNITDILYGARYIYFVPRNAYDANYCRYTFTIGNIGDLFFGFKNDWGKHGLEIGATERFQFGARIWPFRSDIIKKTDYTQVNVYAAYKYKFFIKEVPSRLIFTLSYGFDERPNQFSSKYVVTAWTSWGINF